jgi:hypothetical protein
MTLVEFIAKHNLDATAKGSASLSKEARMEFNTLVRNCCETDGVEAIVYSQDCDKGKIVENKMTICKPFADSPWWYAYQVIELYHEEPVQKNVLIFKDGVTGVYVWITNQYHLCIYDNAAQIDPKTDFLTCRFLWTYYWLAKLAQKIAPERVAALEQLHAKQKAEWIEKDRLQEIENKKLREEREKQELQKAKEKKAKSIADFLARKSDIEGVLLMEIAKEDLGLSIPLRTQGVFKYVITYWNAGELTCGRYHQIGRTGKKYLPNIDAAATLIKGTIYPYLQKQYGQQA